MSQTVSIIGCGWLGLPCAIRLLQFGYQVKGSTTTEDKIPILTSHAIVPYLLQLDSAIPPSDLFECDILFINFPPGRGAENIITRYHQRIEKVIQSATKASVKKVIFASSTGVYAGTEDKPFVTEDTPVNPLRDSAKAMQAGENLLSTYTDQLTVLRLAGLVGPGRQAAKFLAGKKDLPNPDNAVNLVHLDDCVNVVHQIIAQDKFGQTYNVVADKHPSRKAYYTKLTQEAGLTPPTFSTKQTSPDKIVSNEKIKGELSFQFQHQDPFHF